MQATHNTNTYTCDRKRTHAHMHTHMHTQYMREHAPPRIAPRSWGKLAMILSVPHPLHSPPLLSCPTTPSGKPKLPVARARRVGAPPERVFSGEGRARSNFRQPRAGVSSAAHRQSMRQERRHNTAIKPQSPWLPIICIPLSTYLLDTFITSFFILADCC